MGVGRHYGKFGDEKFPRDCWGGLAPESERREKSEVTPQGCVTLPVMVGERAQGTLHWGLEAGGFQRGE